MQPNDIIEQVKASGLRGRGGAGFPTGLKWQFVAQGHAEAEVHLLQRRRERAGHVQGPRADGAQPAPAHRGLRDLAATPSAPRSPTSTSAASSTTCSRSSRPRSRRPTRPGFLGKNILGSGFDCDVYVHRGAGAYEAGEETALIESLEGKRAQPRIKPPFPAVAGLYQCPTAVNNVETLCNVPLDRAERAGVVRRARVPRRTAGRSSICISGHVKRPGVYEASMHTTLRELIYGEQFAQGMAGGKQVQGHHPRRVVGAAAARRAPRHAGQLRRRAEGRVAARLGRPDRARRDGVHGVAGDEPAALLPPRVVRQVHAVPRGRRLAVSSCCSASSAAKGRRRTSTCCSAWPTTSSARRCARSATPRRRRC